MLRFFLICSVLLLTNAGAMVAGDKSAPAADAAEKRDAKRFVTVSVAEFEKLREDRKNIVLDVRTADEFKAGHLPGAVNIDVNSTAFKEKVAKLDKSKTYLVHCAAGVRSAKACNLLAPLKFEKLYNLEGGLNAWEKAGKPVER